MYQPNRNCLLILLALGSLLAGCAIESYPQTPAVTAQPPATTQHERVVVHEPVIIHDALPPPRTEIVPVAPYAGALWVPGQWVATSDGWRWNPGHWEE